MATTYRPPHPFASQPLPALPSHSQSQPSGSSSSSAHPRNHQSSSRFQPSSKPSQKKTRTRTETTTSSFSNSSQTTQGTIPEITCSACGMRLGMDQLGEHVCETGPERTGSGQRSETNRPQERDHRQVPQDTFEQPRNERAAGRSDEDQARTKAKEEKRSTLGLTLDMSTLRPPDTTGFLGIGDAGMAGVGRRGFGEFRFSASERDSHHSHTDVASIMLFCLGNSPTTPTYSPFARSASPQTPPAAAMATPPARVNVGSQNQSQPYFIASHANFNRPGGNAAATTTAAGAQGHELGPPAGYRERQASPMLDHPDWNRSRDKVQPRDIYPRDDRRGQQTISTKPAQTRQHPSFVAPPVRSGIPIRLDIDPDHGSSHPAGVPDTKNLHSPVLVPQTATSGSTFGLASRSGDERRQQQATTAGLGGLGSPQGNASILTFMTSSLKTAISGGGTSHPRPDLTPSEYGRRVDAGSAAAVKHEKETGVMNRSRSRSNASAVARVVTRASGAGQTHAKAVDPPSNRSSIEERSMEKRSLRVTNASPEPEETLDVSEGTGVGNTSRWGTLRNVVQVAASIASTGISSTIQRSNSVLNSGASRSGADQSTSFLDVPAALPIASPGAISTTTSTLSDPSRPGSARSNESAATLDPDSPVTRSQPLAGSGKLPFFERYKQMADNNKGATSIVRQISRSSSERFGVSGNFQNLGDHSSGLTESHARARVRENTNDSSLPWLRTESEISALEHRLEGPPSKSFSGTSLSSVDSTTEGKGRVVELAIITPSASMNRLDGTVPSTYDERGAVRVKKPSDETAEIEGLMEDLKADLDRFGNASQEEHEESSRLRLDRDSYQSSMLAPSDSISTPGFDLQRRRSASTKINQAVPGKKACQKCGLPLRGQRYVKRDGIVLCEADYKEMFLPKVSGSRDASRVFSFGNESYSHYSVGDALFLSRRQPFLHRTVSSKANGTERVLLVMNAMNRSAAIASMCLVTSRIVSFIITASSESLSGLRIA
jgi:hypothetical protein